MRAMILAEGCGARIQLPGNQQPTCLLRFAATRLLERLLQLLRGAGVASAPSIRNCGSSDSGRFLRCAGFLG
jgi:choline kinase